MSRAIPDGRYGVRLPDGFPGGRTFEVETSKGRIVRCRFRKDAARLPPPPSPWGRRLTDTFAGKRVSLDDLPLSMEGLPPFQRRALAALRRLPRGHTCTYGELARWAGSPRAARAVGNAMAANPFPILVPCHRVVRSDGTLGRYSGGGEGVKRALLRRERGVMGGRKTPDPKLTGRERAARISRIVRNPTGRRHDTI